MQLPPPPADAGSVQAASAGGARDADTAVAHRVHSGTVQHLPVVAAERRAHSAGWDDDTAPDGGAGAGAADARVDGDGSGGDCASRRRDDDAPWGRCLLPSSLGQLFFVASSALLRYCCWQLSSSSWGNAAAAS